MEIVFKEAAKTFHLYNDQISYIMQVLPNGQMGQLYFGKRIHDREGFLLPSGDCVPSYGIPAYLRTTSRSAWITFFRSIPHTEREITKALRWRCSRKPAAGSQALSIKDIRSRAESRASKGFPPPIQRAKKRRLH